MAVFGQFAICNLNLIQSYSKQDEQKKIKIKHSTQLGSQFKLVKQLSHRAELINTRIVLLGLRPKRSSPKVPCLVKMFLVAEETTRRGNGWLESKLDALK